MKFDPLKIRKFLRSKNNRPNVINDNLSDEEREIKRKIQKSQRKYVIILFSIPLLILFTYFYGIGRKRFFVRSDVVVRKAGGNSTSFSIGNILTGGNSLSLEDSRYLRTYLESPQVLRDLKKEINFFDLYKRKWPDYFAGLQKGYSQESEYNLFRRQITVTLNEIDGILRIRTLSFDPDTALYLNKFLINRSEDFVNILNQSIFKRQLVFAEEEVKKNAKRFETATKLLNEYQQKYQLMNPLNDFQAKGSFFLALEDELVRKKIDLALKTKRFVDQNSPEIIDLKEQIKEIEETLKKEKELILSPMGKDLNKKIAKFMELDFNKKYYEDLYKQSLIAAEKARVDSNQQQRFIAIISNPVKPETEWKYWRHKGFLTSLLIITITFALSKFIISMADSHKN